MSLFSVDFLYSFLFIFWLSISPSLLFPPLLPMIQPSLDIVDNEAVTSQSR